VRNIYEMDTPEELAVVVRESQEKERVLHEARMAAYDEMVAAIARHRFQVSACDTASRETGNARTQLESLIRQQAYEAVIKPESARRNDDHRRTPRNQA